MEPSDDRVRAGQAIYAPWSLGLYDVAVHAVSNHWLWRCPTHQLQRLYDRNVSARHIDIGVGTGYFLAHAHWPVAAPEIMLVDLNPHCLQRAARRIGRYRPQTVRANVLQPFPEAVDGSFQSAGLCYLLHCLPGSITEKAVVFDHLIAHLAKGAHVFGATIVQGDAPRSAAARRLMAIYNRKGVFCNAQDTLADLDTALRQRFDEVDTRLIGCVALFEARVR